MDELDKISAKNEDTAGQKASDITNFPDSINPINKAFADKADDGAVDTANAFNAGNAIDTDGSTVNDSEVTAEGKVFGGNAVTGGTETEGTFTAHQRNGAENAATESGTENAIESTADTTAENGQNAQSACQDAAYAQSANPDGQNAGAQGADTQYAGAQGGSAQGMPGGSAPYGQYTPPPPRQPYGAPPYGQGYGAPYGQYGNRPYNGYYHIPPVPPVYGCGRGQGQPYGGQNGQHPQGQGYGVPYGHPPVNPYYQNAANGANSSVSAKDGQKPQKKRMSKGLIAFICVACCVAVGVIGLSVGILAGKAMGKIDFNDNKSSFSVIEGDQAGSPSDFDLNTEGATDRTMTYEQVISSVSDSVVSITVYSSSGSAGAIASGIIMDKDGYILTNDHIYSEVPNASFLITLSSGTEFKASFVSGDKKSDLAILKIDNPSGLSPATFATESVKTGQEVLAIGASAGLDGSVTQGIVSAVDRRVSNGTSSEKFIQTTAAINPGTSGGALVNMSGQVVGICSSKYASTDIDNVCFAIPTTRALGVIDQLKAYGKVTNRAKLGITYTYINTVAAELKDVPTGLLVKSIDRDSSLKSSGIKENDIITQVDDTDIVSADQVLDIVEKAQIGDEVKLTVYSSETGAYFTVTGTYIKSDSQSSYTTEDDTTSYNTQNPYDFFEDYGK